MRLWLISQNANSGYDTYDSAVVAAENENEARLINPDGREWGKAGSLSAWAWAPEQVSVKLIGEAAPDVTSGVVLASFNAG